MDLLFPFLTLVPSLSLLKLRPLYSKMLYMFHLSLETFSLSHNSVMITLHLLNSYPLLSLLRHFQRGKLFSRDNLKVEFMTGKRLLQHFSQALLNHVVTGIIALFIHLSLLSSISIHNFHYKISAYLNQVVILAILIKAISYHFLNQL